MNRLLAAFRDDENLCGWYYQCKYSMKYQILHVVDQSPSVWLRRAGSLCRCGIVTLAPSPIPVIALCLLCEFLLVSPVMIPDDCTQVQPNFFEQYDNMMTSKNACIRISRHWLSRSSTGHGPCSGPSLWLHRARSLCHIL